MNYAENGGGPLRAAEKHSCSRIMISPSGSSAGHSCAQGIGTWAARQTTIPIAYRGIRLHTGFRADLLIDQGGEAIMPSPRPSAVLRRSPRRLSRQCEPHRPVPSHPPPVRTPVAGYWKVDPFTVQGSMIPKRLVPDRLPLTEDADRLIAMARESWDVYRVL